MQINFSFYKGRSFRLVAVFLCFSGLVNYSHAETDVQINNRQGKEMTPLMPELSCAKKARRVKKLDSKLKRRKFIKGCQAERAVRLEAEKIAEQWEDEEKKEAEEKVFQEFLKKGKKRADKKMKEEEEEEEE